MDPFFFFHFKLFSSKIWSTQFFQFIKIHKNQKPRNIFVVYSILEYLERLGNTSIVQGVLALVVQQIPKEIFFKDVIVLEL